MKDFFEKHKVVLSFDDYGFLLALAKLHYVLLGEPPCERLLEIEKTHHAKRNIFLTADETLDLIDLLSSAEDQRKAPYSYDACAAWERILRARYGESK